MNTRELLNYCRPLYPNCLGYINENEFKRDVVRVIMVRKMCGRFFRTGNLNHKAIINNIVVLVNIFGADTTLHLINETFNVNEKKIVYAFTNWLGLSDINGVSEDILAVLSDVEKRMKMI